MKYKGFSSSLPVEFDAQPCCKNQFFPEANEVDFARQSVFSGASFKLDYLTKPSFFEDFGFFKKVKMSDRVKEEDELFIAAYPYFNVNGKSTFFVIVNINNGRKFHDICFVAFQKCLLWKNFTEKLS